MKRTFYSIFFIFLIIKPFFAETKIIATMNRTKLTYQDMVEIFNDELQKSNCYSNYLWNYKVYTEENNQNNSWSIQTRNDGYKGNDGTFIKELSVILNMDNGFIEYRTYEKPTTYSGKNTTNNKGLIFGEIENWDNFLEESCKWKKRWQCKKNWTMEQFNAIDRLLEIRQKITLWDLITLSYKNNETIKQYVTVGGNVNKLNNRNMSVLHETVLQKDAEFIKYLINIGADVNIRNGISKTPLHVASEEGEYKIVKLLI